MRGRALLALATVALLVACLVACRDSSPAPAVADQGKGQPAQAPAPAPARQSSVVLTTPSGTSTVVAVELARTDPERQRGLMFRKQMGDDEGMLFLMGEERPHRFWMKNTYIPLDMIWIGSNLMVRGVTENARPLTLDLRGIDAPSLYVLEVNAHYAKTHGIVPGTRVELRDVP